VANSVSAIVYTQVTRRIGYVQTITLAAMFLAITVGVLVVAPSAVAVVVAVGVTGLLNGTIIPATASMIGLETPSEIQSTVFGFNASSVAVGFFLGPLIAGGVAAASGVASALAVSAGLAVVLAVLLAVGTREPMQTIPPTSRAPSSEHGPSA
jgi:MFS family permease